MNCSINVDSKYNEFRVNYSIFNDYDLLRLIGESQDRAALSELYERYKLPVIGFLKRKACDSRSVDEIYNDVMFVVWEKASNFRGESKVSTWLFGIAYRMRLSHGRKERKHTKAASDEMIDDNAVYEYSDTRREASLRESIQTALEKLSKPHRTAIELAYFHGYSTSEISKIVNCPTNTIKTRLFHARKKLKAVLELEQKDSATPLKESRPKKNQ